MASGVQVVIGNIKQIYEQRIMEAKALSISYAGKAVSLCRSRQAGALHIPGKARGEVNVSKALAWAESKAGSSTAESMGEAWVNRTMRAYRTIYGIAEPAKEEKTCIGFHIEGRVPYMAYLEFMQNRRFAIIEPAIRKVAPEYLKKLQELFNA